MRSTTETHAASINHWCSESIARMAEEISRSADTSRRIGITSLGLLDRDGGSVLPMCGAIDDAAVASEFVTVSLLT